MNSTSHNRLQKMKTIKSIIMHYYLRKFLVFFIQLLLIDFSSEKDTLSTGQALTDADFLISAKKTFTLGFFSPGTTSNRYLGIWYSNLKQNKVVWVANRDKPVNDSFGVLSFHTPNNLVIHGSGLKVLVWSTGFLGPGKNYSAKLLDTGNLVVFEKGKKGVIKWQSFDHPTNTLLPKMKLRVNRRTGLNTSLTSWKLLDDPGSGDYTLRMDVIHELLELSMYKGLNRTWRTGPLNGARLGEISPRLTFNVTYVDNEDGVYMTYNIRERSTFSVMAVMSFGLMAVSKWNPDTLKWTEVQFFPNDVCDSYNVCGPNTYCVGPEAVKYECLCFPGFEPENRRKLVGGCVRKRDGNVCRNGEGFVKLSNMKIPDARTARTIRRGLMKECEEDCLKDCSCTAFANATTIKGNIACVMWYGNLLDIRRYRSGGQDLFVRVDQAELENSKKQQHY